MGNGQWVLRGRRIVLPNAIESAAVVVRGETFADVLTDDAAIAAAVATADRVLDAGDFAVLPGFVDAHVHVNDPGRTHWEGFDTATRAAAAGGITTLIDMPLNSIPATTSVAALNAKLAAARGKLAVDVGFWGGVVPGNAAELAPLFAAGVRGFKCFLVPSGVDEFACVTESDLRAAMPILAELGAVLLVHAEVPGPLDAVAADWAAADPRRYAAYLASRPPAAEVEAIAMMIALCREFGTRVHIVHLATEAALPALRAARAEGLPITVETCPHYLRFSAEQIGDGETVFKCAPPIRAATTRESLWQALLAGDIDLVASDHSPSPPDLKCLGSGDFRAAWGGIASLQLLFTATWTAARNRQIGLDAVARWLAKRPAKLAGVWGQKGAIAPGFDADFVILDPDAAFTVEAAKLAHRHAITPYDGHRQVGEIRATYLRGEAIFAAGEFPRSSPTGRPLVGREPS